MNRLILGAVASIIEALVYIKRAEIAEKRGDLESAYEWWDDAMTTAAELREQP